MNHENLVASSEMAQPPVQAGDWLGDSAPPLQTAVDLGRIARAVRSDETRDTASQAPSASRIGDGPNWKDRALCAETDPEAFFPEKGGSTREAKRVCLNCEVRPQCLSFALRNDERFGIWGGLSERERRRLKKTQG